MAPKLPPTGLLHWWNRTSIYRRNHYLGVIGAVCTAGGAVTGGVAYLWGFFAEPEPAPTPPPGMEVNVQGDGTTIVQGNQTTTVVNNIGLTLHEHEESLTRREAEVRAQLGTAHGAEVDTLNAQLAEIQRQQQNLEDSYAKALEDIAELSRQLESFGGTLPRDRIAAAQEALSRGDRSAADALLAEVQERTADATTQAAQAAYLRGQIAEGEIRWADAARYYAEAARLNPRFDHLYKAREFAWRMGDYPAALRLGEDLLRLARAGDDRQQLATALNEHALTLHDTARHAEAEPLFLEALEITRETLGPRHPDVATSLNNLAELLRATGRYAEAEPLYREALEIGRETLGPRHPQVATGLNNLANLLRNTARHAEAEPLYREALEIGRETLGPRHPDVAIWLHNLATLLAQTNRPDEATPLFLDSLGIFRETLGDTHPDTRTIAANTLYHLRQFAPDHPDLPALTAAFP